MVCLFICLFGFLIDCLSVAIWFVFIKTKMSFVRIVFVCLNSILFVCSFDALFVVFVCWLQLIVMFVCKDQRFFGGMARLQIDFLSVWLFVSLFVCLFVCNLYQNEDEHCTHVLCLVEWHGLANYTLADHRLSPRISLPSQSSCIWNKKQILMKF